jgi:hypothetical protein
MSSSLPLVRFITHARPKAVPLPRVALGHFPDMQKITLPASSAAAAEKLKVPVFDRLAGAVDVRLDTPSGMCPVSVALLLHQVWTWRLVFGGEGSHSDWCRFP